MEELQALKPANRRSTCTCGSSLPEPAVQAWHVGLLARPEAGVAGASVGRADRPAAGLGHRTEAGLPAGDQHAHVAAALALEAHRLAAQLRPSADAQRGQQLQQLPRVDRAAAQLGVHLHVLGDRRAGRQRLDVIRRRGRPRRARRARRPSCAAPGCRPPWRRRRSSPAGASAHGAARSPRAWSGVLTEPSTSSTSYGPSERWRSPRGTRRSRSARSTAGAGPRGRAASAGSRRTRPA